LADGICYAVEKGAKVISISLGGLPSTYLDEAVNYAFKENVIVCAAAGNFVQFVTAPGSCENAIGVAATTFYNGAWPNSCRGPAVDIAAPGESVWCSSSSLGQNNTITESIWISSGTSFAVTHVAGVAAMWLSFHKPEQLKKRYPGEGMIPKVFKYVLQKTANQVTASGGYQSIRWSENQFGAGLLNAGALMNEPLPVQGSFQLKSKMFSEPADAVYSVIESFGSENGISRLKSALGAESIFDAAITYPHEFLFHLYTNPSLRNQLRGNISTPAVQAVETRSRMSDAFKNSLE